MEKEREGREKREYYILNFAVTISCMYICRKGHGAVYMHNALYLAHTRYSSLIFYFLYFLHSQSHHEYHLWWDLFLTSLLYSLERLPFQLLNSFFGD